MARNPRNRENLIGKGFESRPNDINRNGRPRKLLSSILDELKCKDIKPVTPEQIKEVISVLLNMPKDEIEEIANNPENPIYITTIAKRLVNADEMVAFFATETLLDRGHGKPTQRTELTGKDGEDLKIEWKETRTYDPDKKTN